MLSQPCGAFLFDFGLWNEFHNFSQRFLWLFWCAAATKPIEQRMRLVRFALKFRMELARHKKRMILHSMTRRACRRATNR